MERKIVLLEHSSEWTCLIYYACYYSVVHHLLGEVQRVGKACNVIVATHNEASVLNAISRMRELDILPSDNMVVFGQIFGIASNITVKLGNIFFIQLLAHEIWTWTFQLPKAT